MVSATVGSAAALMKESCDVLLWPASETWHLLVLVNPSLDEVFPTLHLFLKIKARHRTTETRPKKELSIHGSEL